LGVRPYKKFLSVKNQRIGGPAVIALGNLLETKVHANGMKQTWKMTGIEIVVEHDSNNEWLDPYDVPGYFWRKVQRRTDPGAIFIREKVYSITVHVQRPADAFTDSGC
jgi:hypothetical protein